MSEIDGKLLGKPLFLLPNPVPVPPFPPPQISNGTGLLPLPNLWDPILNPGLLSFPLPPPQIGLPNPLLDLFNPQFPPPLLPLPLNTMFPLGFPNPMLPLPKFPVPLMSLRIPTPPPFRAHPYRSDSIDLKENKHRRSRKNSEGNKKKGRYEKAAGRAAEGSRSTQVINGAIPDNQHYPYQHYISSKNGSYWINK